MSDLYLEMKDIRKTFPGILANDEVSLKVNMGFAREVKDRVVLIDDGKVVEEGAPEEVFNSPKHDRTKLFLSKIL